MTLTIEIPDDAPADKRERLAVALYDAQAMSQGTAAQVAGVSRSEFLDALGRYKVSPFQYDADEILADADVLAQADAQAVSLREKRRVKSA